MSMDSPDNSASDAALTAALAAELQRQGINNADVEALARVVQSALVPEAPADEGKRPDELNATNDD